MFFGGIFSWTQQHSQYTHILTPSHCCQTPSWWCLIFPVQRKGSVALVRIWSICVRLHWWFNRLMSNFTCSLVLARCFQQIQRQTCIQRGLEAQAQQELMSTFTWHLPDLSWRKDRPSWRPALDGGLEKTGSPQEMWKNVVTKEKMRNTFKSMKTSKLVGAKELKCSCQ